jgi:hypothetical protein
MVDDFMQRVAVAQARPGEQATPALAALWEELDEDAPVARLAVAHAMADSKAVPARN